MRAVDLQHARHQGVDALVLLQEAREAHVHVAFTASTRAEVDAFYAAAMAAGAKDNGSPGLRPHYHETYYAAFVLDEGGHNIEAVCHRPE